MGVVVDRVERHLVEELGQLALVLGPQPDELLQLHAGHEGEGPLAGPQSAGGRAGDARRRALEGGQRHGDPLRAVAQLVAELVDRLVELVGADHLIEPLALLRRERRAPRPGHLAEVRVQERGAHALFPRLRPRSEPLGQPGLARAGLEPAREPDLRGVGERAQHARDVLQRALLQAALGDGPRGLALEVQDGQAVGRPEELAQVVVAVDADLHDVAAQEGVQAAQPLLETSAVARDTLGGLLEGRRQGRHPGCEGLRRPAGLRPHLVAPGRDVARADRLGRQGVARRGRAQRAVQAAGERADPRGLVRVGRRQGAGEHRVRRLRFPSFDRRPVVLGEPLQRGGPGVPLVRNELVQHPERRRRRAVGLVGDGPGEPGGAGKGRAPREEVGELELRTRSDVQAPEDLEDRAAVVDHRRVALLAADGPGLPGRDRQDLRQGWRRGEAESAGPAGKREVAPDGLEEGQAERRITRRVDDRLAAGSRRHRHAVALPAAVGEEDVEEGDLPRRARQRRLVHGGHLGHVPVLAAEPAPARQGLPKPLGGPVDQRPGRRRRGRAGGRLAATRASSAHGPSRRPGRARASAAPRPPS